MAFIYQTQYQDAPVGQGQHLAARGLQAWRELSEHAALSAKAQVRRTVRVQAGQAEVAAVVQTDFGRDQQSALAVDRNVIGQAPLAAGEIDPGFAGAGKTAVKLSCRICGGTVSQGAVNGVDGHAASPCEST